MKSSTKRYRSGKPLTRQKLDCSDTEQDRLLTTWKHPPKARNSPHIFKLRTSPVEKCRSANTSPRNSSRKTLRDSSNTKRVLKTQARVVTVPRALPHKRPPLKKPLAKKSGNLSNNRSITPETGNSPQLSAIITRVTASSQRKKNLHLTEQEVQERCELIYKEHLFATFQALKFVRTLPPVDSQQLREKRRNFPKRPQRKLVVFDLDETLVHCCDDVETSDPDFIVPVTFPTGEVIEAGINLRPYAIDCLKRANENFEVAVFTASHQCYADAVLDHLDRGRELIQHRLYRDDCVYTEGIYVKDLRVIGNRDLKNIVIIDNAAYSFGYQLENGIPIISWHDDYYDKELYNLMDYLTLIAECEDVRKVNRETFNLANFYDDYIQEVLGTNNEILRSKSPDIIRNLANVRNGN